jgi:hypothetical protein
MQDLSPKQIKRIERALKLEEGILAPILESIDELEDKLEDLTGKPEIKGDDGYTPIKGKDYFDGEDGEDYVLTEKDKEEIASQIKVPVVEKEIIIEKTEVIKEQPIVTNEIKEVAVADTAEQIVDKINTLPEEPDKQIDIKHIKGWKKLVEELIGKSKTVFVGGGSGGRLVKTYDLSPDLNGVTKTFTLPAFWRIIDVQIGTIPPLRPTVDYTSNAGNMTLTFTDEIDASTYLSTGLSAIVIYSE